jgi:hypothetical protein
MLSKSQTRSSIMFTPNWFLKISLSVLLTMLFGCLFIHLKQIVAAADNGSLPNFKSFENYMIFRRIQLTWALMTHAL